MAGPACAAVTGQDNTVDPKRAHTIFMERDDVKPKKFNLKALHLVQDRRRRTEGFGRRWPQWTDQTSQPSSRLSRVDGCGTLLRAAARRAGARTLWKPAQYLRAALANWFQPVRKSRRRRPRACRPSIHTCSGASPAYRPTGWTSTKSSGSTWIDKTMTS